MTANMTRTLIALSVFAAFGASATSTISASSVKLNNGGTVETAISQHSGQIAGLGADVLSLSARNAQQDKDIHDTYVLANTKYTEAAGKALEGTVASHYKELQGEVNTRQAADDALAREVKTKVSQADFKADQQRQDAALDEAITYTVKEQAQTDRAQNDHINAVQGAAQSANEKADAGAVRMDGIEKQAGVLDTRTGKTEVRLDTVEGGVRQTNTQLDADRAATQVRIEQEQSNRATQDRVITDRVRKEEAARADADAGLSARIDTKVDTGVFNQRAAVVDSRFADTQQRIDTNKTEQARINKAVAGTLTNHEQRIAGLEQQTNSRFANIDRRLDEVKDHASAGTAAAFAQANIPQVMAGGEFGIGAGAGTYSNQSAVAVGASYAPNDRLVLKATVSTDTQHNFGAGAGVMVSFR